MTEVFEEQPRLHTGFVNKQARCKRQNVQSIRHLSLDLPVEVEDLGERVHEEGAEPGVVHAAGPEEGKGDHHQGHGGQPQVVGRELKH